MAKKASGSVGEGKKGVGARTAKAGAAKRAKVVEAPEGDPLLAVPATPEMGSVVGQERAIGVLRRAAASGRLHHAWLFHGPEGVGKFTTALAFAGELLTPSGAPGREASRLLASGMHPDLHVVRKELASISRDEGVRSSKQLGIAIEVVREFLIEPASRTRVASGSSPGSKVFIVDEAHLLGPEAQDALLKTLEEPAPGTVIVLVTHIPERLKATVRSRCQRVAFGTLDEGAMRSWLAGSGLEVPKDVMTWALRFASGSPGALRAAVESGLVAWQAAVGSMLDKATQGRTPVELGGVLAKLVDESAAAAVEHNPRASKEAANRVAARRMFRLLGERCREELAAGAQRGDAPALERAAEALDRVAAAERQVDSNVALALVFDNLAAQWAAQWTAR